jgi:hypothetical protein
MVSGLALWRVARRRIFYEAAAAGATPDATARHMIAVTENVGRARLESLVDASATLAVVWRAVRWRTIQVGEVVERRGSCK